MTWWQVFIVFWIVGFSSRLDEKLKQDREFRYGLGLAIRFVIDLALTVGAWLLVSTWAGISW